MAPSTICRRLIFDSATGIFTCPDGTEVKSELGLMDCPALNDLVHPGCASGEGATCP
jgi:hypothetical protein